jgi:glycosyltransferase involved in cell wall biosynthesis
MLETWVESQQVSSVEFAGWSDDVEHELGAAGILLAPATAEPFGLSVVEAMAAGVPVVACAGGGHLETVGRVPAAPSFQPGDAGGAAAGLRSLLDDAVRQALSAAGRAVAAEEFSLSSHVDRLIDEYSSLAHGGRSGARN